MAYLLAKVFSLFFVGNVEISMTERLGYACHWCFVYAVCSIVGAVLHIRTSE